MDGFLEWISSTPAIALTILIIVFVVTLALVVKRLIGFVFTLILLAITIVSGYAAMNYEKTSEYLQTLINKQDQDPSNDEGPDIVEDVKHHFNKLSDYFKKSE